MAGVFTMAVFDTSERGLPLAAGVTIYVAASDLIPESTRNRREDGAGGLSSVD